MNIKIRRIKTIDEYRTVVRLEKKVWKFRDIEVVPIQELVVANKNGGIVLGAFSGKKMVAFCFGSPGYKSGEIYLYSRMLGVLPEFENLNIGYRLKIAQREFALKEGYRRVIWTFDPLKSKNAYFNIVKLGCIIRRYEENIYGELFDQFNRGMPTDRFYAEWYIASRRVSQAIEGKSHVIPFEIAFPAVETAIERNYRIPIRIRTCAGVDAAKVEIPADIGIVKKANPRAALAWRMTTRKIFTTLFSRGFVVTGFITKAIEGERRSFYILENGSRVRGVKLNEVERTDRLSRSASAR